MISFKELIHFICRVTQFQLRTPTTGQTKTTWLRDSPSLSVRARSSGASACFRGQVSTSGLAEENEAPDTGGGADDQASGQHHPVRNPAAQPAHEEEARDDLNPTQAVHQAVAQLAEAEVALRQRGHHGLEGVKDKQTGLDLVEIGGESEIGSNKIAKRHCTEMGGKINQFMPTS